VIAEILELKNLINRMLPMSDAALHMNFGLAVFWLSLLSRRYRSTMKWALIALLVLCAANEAIDLHARGLGSWRGSVKDTFNTVFWPAMLWFAISRLGPVRETRSNR